MDTTPKPVDPDLEMLDQLERELHESSEEEAAPTTNTTITPISIPSRAPSASVERSCGIFRKDCSNCNALNKKRCDVISLE